MGRTYLQHFWLECFSKASCLQEEPLLSQGKEVELRAEVQGYRYE